MTDIGDDITIATAIKVGGVLTDPVSVTVVVTSPSGVAVSPAPTVSNDGTGLRSAVFNGDAAGRWLYTWTTTGPAGKDHGYVDVGVDPPTRLEPLATLADLEERIAGRTLTADEKTRALVLLRDASSKIRRYTGGQTFQLVTDDVIVIRPVGWHLRLPQRPVLAVSSVVAVGTAPLPDVTLPAGTWAWDGVEDIELYPWGSWIINLPESYIDGSAAPASYRVTNTHGYAVIPDDVISVCCDATLRTLLAPSMVDGLTSERIGEYGYQFGQFKGGQSVGASVRLSDEDKDVLKDYRRPMGTIALRAR